MRRPASAPDRRRRSSTVVTVRSVYAAGSIGKGVWLARPWAPRVITAMVHREMHPGRTSRDRYEVSAVHRMQ